MPQKKQEKKKPYFANTPAYRKKLAKGTKPGAAKKGTRVYKRKQAVVKAKKGLSKLAERLNPFDKESKERRAARKRTRIGKKAVKAGERQLAGKAAKGTGIISTKKSRAKAISAKAGTSVRRKAVKKVSTKRGGDYVKYEKKSKAAGSFRSAFKSKCAGGAKSFSWDGRSYSCGKAGPKKAKKPIVKGGTKGSAEYGS